MLDRTHQGPGTAELPGGSSDRVRVVVGLAIAGVLGVLYGYRRRRYIAAWIGAWLLLAASGYIISRGYASVGQVVLSPQEEVVYYQKSGRLLLD